MADPTRRAQDALGKRLRELRAATGLKGRPFAARLGPGWDQPRISRLETVTKLPSDDELVAWAAATGGDLAELTVLRDRARREAALAAAFPELFSQEGGAAAYQDALATAERAAARLAFYYQTMPPGPVQTAAYAWDMLHLPGGPAAYGASEEDIGRLIAARVRRGAVLHEPGHEVTVLMGEVALRNRYAPPAVMAEQCEHIARLAEAPIPAVIGVIPFTAQLPFAAVSVWEILDDLMLIETEEHGLPVTDPERVKQFWGHTEALAGVALTGGDAARLCRSAGAEHATR